MKKIFLFAATAAMLAACSSDQLEGVESAQQKAADNAINFSAYTPRTVTRAGLPGDASTTPDFGILAYYTDDSKYDSENSKPNFMYNTKVSHSTGSWVYNPVMYWPNEFGATATADYFDYVSFFAYAPYVEVENTTGIPVVEPIEDYDAFVTALGLKSYTYTLTDITTRALFQEAYNGGVVYADADYYAAVIAKTGVTPVTSDAEALTALSTAGLQFNKATPVNITSLTQYQTYLQGASATPVTEDAAKATLDNINKEQYQGKNITAISKNSAQGDPIVKYAVDPNPEKSVDLLWGVAYNKTAYTPIAGNDPVVVGKPFIDLVKPKDPQNDKVFFNLRHALAKLNVDIKYIADAETPAGASQVIEMNKTRIYVRWIKIGGFVMKGALNLNNTEANKANWKSFDGTTALTTGAVTFYDGRKDGKEGTEGGTANGETPNGLNPNITENYVPWAWTTPEWASYKSPGVTDTPVNLFGDGGAAATDPIFVIPTGEDIDIEICYDVQTADNNLATFLVDGLSRGSLIKNTIRKKASEIFTAAGSTGKMTDNKAYTIHIILGMTSVKIDATVEPWSPLTPANVDLPYNTHP